MARSDDYKRPLTSPTKRAVLTKKNKTMKNNFNFFKLFSSGTPLESRSNRANNEKREPSNRIRYQLKFRTNDFLTEI
jgi:hypothetical protein